jgi:RNA polymerase sigma-70 factor (ECF subfamily)
MTDDEVAEAYQRFGSLVLRRCRRILRDDAAARDALQDVFVRLWRYGDNFRAAESKLGWLYRVADRCCFDHLSRARDRREAGLDLRSVVETISSPARGLEDREIVLRFLSRFDDRVKMIAVLHYLDEMTQEEIARETGWSRQTVFKKLAFLRERAQALRVLLCGKEGPA